MKRGKGRKRNIVHKRGRRKIENFPAVRQLSATRIKDGDGFQPLLSAPSE